MAHFHIFFKFDIYDYTLKKKHCVFHFFFLYENAEVFNVLCLGKYLEMFHHLACSC
jgi:hypothetical protein